MKLPVRSICEIQNPKNIVIVRLSADRKIFEDRSLESITGYGKKLKEKNVWYFAES